MSESLKKFLTSIDVRAILRNIFLILLTLAPIFTLTISKWIGVIFFSCSLISVIYITLYFQKNWVNSKFTIAILTSFLSPFLAIFFSQLIRGNLEWSDYDSPSRFLFAMPILIWVASENLPITQILRYSIPLTPIMTFILLPHLPKTGWTTDLSIVGVVNERLATYFVDPITFGRIMLSFGLLSLINLRFSRKIGWEEFLGLIGCGFGIYLSIQSGSRTGWVALPILLLINIPHQIRKNSRKFSFILSLILVSAISLSLYINSERINKRVNLALEEIKTYQLDKLNTDSSVGMRISFIRMGCYYFLLQPLSGFGDNGFKKHINDEELKKFASQNAREFVTKSGFHNELISNAVRSGIWGVISTTLIFLLPFTLFVHAIRAKKDNRVALLGLGYIVCELISSMSIEVLSLKLTATLFAFMIAILCGATIQSIKSKSASSNASIPPDKTIEIKKG